MRSATRLARAPRASRRRTRPPRVSSATSISIDFSVPMDRADVEGRFAISPKIKGSLTWKRGSLVFTPTERLHPGTRYTISVIGAHDLTGNALGGTGNFSFIVQSSAQLTKTDPEDQRHGGRTDECLDVVQSSNGSPRHEQGAPRHRHRHRRDGRGQGGMEREVDAGDLHPGSAPGGRPRLRGLARQGRPRR